MMKNALREDNQNPEIQVLKAAMKETKYKFFIRIGECFNEQFITRDSK
jgi:hypothetical protein